MAVRAVFSRCMRPLAKAIPFRFSLSPTSHPRPTARLYSSTSKASTEKEEKTGTVAAAPDKWPLLHLAIRLGDVDNIIGLLEVGENPNQVWWGYTPLTRFLDAHYWSIPVLKALLEGGANPNLADSKGRIPLHMALLNVEECKALLAAKADPNPRDFEGHTPLIKVAIRCQKECHHLREWAELLLAAGADVKAVDKEGRTVPDIIMSGDPSMASLRYLAEKFQIPSLTKDKLLGMAINKAYGISQSCDHRGQIMGLWDDEVVPLLEEGGQIDEVPYPLPPHPATEAQRFLAHSLITKKIEQKRKH